MKKITYKKRGSYQGSYLILVDGEVVAAVRRTKATRPEEWSAWGHPVRSIHKVTPGARTRAVATKAILALLEIEL